MSEFDDMTICDRCSKEIPLDETVTGDDDNGEWSGCTLCPECNTESKVETK